MSDVQWYADAADAALASFLKQTPAALKLYHDAAVTLNPDNAAKADGIPADLLQHFERYEAELLAFHSSLGDVKTYVALRTPMIKDEDNSGVHVQESIIGLINKVRGAKPAKDDDTGSDVAVQSKLEYLSSRSKVEKALADCKETPIETYKLHLKELDRQAYLKLRAGWQSLAYHRAVVYNALKLNREKIDNPRRKEYGMNL